MAKVNNKPCNCKPRYKKKYKKPKRGKGATKKTKKTKGRGKSRGGKKVTLTKKKAVKFYNLLKVLEKMPSADFGVLSQYLDEDAYQILTECIHNSICSRSVEPKVRERMRKLLWSKRNKIRYLADKSKPFGKKKKIIPQLGGNIGLIIASVLPMIYNFLKTKKIL